MQNPGVQIKYSSDKMFTGSQTSVAFFAGYFEKGPMNTPIVVNTPLEFKLIFGRATKENYNDWYQCYNFLQYAGNLAIIRTANSVTNATRALFNDAYPSFVINNYDDFLEEYDNITLLALSPIRFIAQTPGSWGNLLSVCMFSYSEYINNDTVWKQTKAKDYGLLKPQEYCILIIRNDVIVETYKYTFEDIENINTLSSYVYVKTSNAVYSGIFDGNLLTADANAMEIIFDGNLLESWFAKPIAINDGILRLTDGSEVAPEITDIQDAYASVENNLDYVIDIVIGNELDNNSAINLVNSRKDCIAFCGIPNIPYTSIENYMSTLVPSDYVSISNNYKKQLDGFTSTNKMVNFVGDIAGLRALINVTDISLTSAGINRGTIKNCAGAKYTLTQAQNDFLYNMGVNTIMPFYTGYYITSERTFTESLGINRVHLRNMFNKMERDISNLLLNDVFELNTQFLRNSITSNIKTYLRNITGIENFKVVCNETNNLEVNIQRNELIVDVYIRTKSIVEYVIIRFTNAGTTSFYELIDNV